jgi:DGQHR domain-containing protein
MRQGPPDKEGGQEFLLAVLPAREVVDRFEVDYVDAIERPEGYQRKLEPNRVKQVATYILEDDQATFPTNILVSIRDAEALTFTPESTNGNYELGTLKLDDFAKLWTVDGQHRTAGLREAIRRLRERAEDGDAGAVEALANLEAYPVPVCIFRAPEKFAEMRTFYVVNDRQKGVPTDVVDELILQHDKLHRQLTDREARRAKAVEVTHALEALEGQPWHKRLLLAGRATAKGTYKFRQHALVASLDPVFRVPYMEQMTGLKAAEILADYWSALERLMPDAFETPELYTIMKSTGVYAWHMVFPNVLELVRVRTEPLRAVQGELVDVFAEILGTAGPWVEAPTWHAQQGSPATKGSSMKTIRDLASQIKRALPRLGEE